MQTSHKYLFAALMGLTVVGGTALVDTTSTAATPAAQERRAERNHWRHHDGHWSYWYQPDKSWYYTDGSNWYYNNHDKWNVYKFDRKFGNDDFERGDYRNPGPDTRIDLPRFKVYVDR